MYICIHLTIKKGAGLFLLKEFKITTDFKDKRPYPDGRDATIIMEPMFDITSIRFMDIR